jgi:hypothetical protein
MVTRHRDRILGGQQGYSDRGFCEGKPEGEF